jgi:hypothetical protein
LKLLVCIRVFGLCLTIFQRHQFLK